MSLHVFAAFVTPFGIAANNRGDNEGTNITPLQKLLWMGEPHTTVSAEAIRFAVRRRLAELEEQGTHRAWNEDLRRNEWRSADVDAEFGKWLQPTYTGFIDDDLLGFMNAEAAKGEAEDTNEDDPVVVVEADKAEKAGRKDREKGRERGTAVTRRAVLEVTRAISLTPWAGEVTFNAASPGATPGAAKKDEKGQTNTNPVPYGTEVHATRYQYGIALTPERLHDKSRAAKAVEALCNLGTVAGNHGRFLFDFSPEAIVIRVTEDPAPRMLYCFDTPDAGKTVTAGRMAKRVADGDIDPKELIIAGVEVARVERKQGVKAACAAAVEVIAKRLKG